MKTTPTVSVLTTCYNREAYLAECIESVLNGHFQDFELIIVDDQSTDGSWDIAKRYATQDERIKIHRNEVNLGDYPNRNKAASLAIGKYIKYIDADDRHGKWVLDIMVDAMENHPAAAIGLFNYNIKTTFPRLLAQYEAIKLHHQQTLDLLNRSPLNAIIRTDIFRTIGGFTEHRHFSDYLLWHRMNLLHPILMLPSWQVHHRKLEIQESNKRRSSPFVAIDMWNYTKSALTSAAAEDIEIALIQEKLDEKTARLIFYSIRKGNWIQAQAQLKHSKKSVFELIGLLFGNYLFTK